jgi:hypothetical protein
MVATSDYYQSGPNCTTATSTGRYVCTDTTGSDITVTRTSTQITIAASTRPSSVSWKRVEVDEEGLAKEKPSYPPILVPLDPVLPYFAYHHWRPRRGKDRGEGIRNFCKKGES